MTSTKRPIFKSCKFNFNPNPSTGSLEYQRVLQPRSEIKSILSLLYGNSSSSLLSMVAGLFLKQFNVQFLSSETDEDARRRFRYSAKSKLQTQRWLLFRNKTLSFVRLTRCSERLLEIIFQKRLWLGRFPLIIIIIIISDARTHTHTHVSLCLHYVAVKWKLTQSVCEMRQRWQICAEYWTLSHLHLSASLPHDIISLCMTVTSSQLK